MRITMPIRQRDPPFYMHNAVHMIQYRCVNKYATQTLALAASLYPLSYGPTVRRKLSACEATDYLLQHLATEHAQLQSAITG